MEQYIFRHPGSLELCILWQALLYLIISPMPSVSLKSSLSLYWLVLSPLKVFYLNFFACSIMWMVNKMRWLPYGATTKRTDNTETLFSNLKNWRQKMDEKWKCVKNRHDVHFWKMDVFQSFFTSFLAPFFIPFFRKMKSKMRSKMDQKWELWTPLIFLPCSLPIYSCFGGEPCQSKGWMVVDENYEAFWLSVVALHWCAVLLGCR